MSFTKLLDKKYSDFIYAVYVTPLKYVINELNY